MARRGALTAIQAALAGLSGGAAGYVRQQELQREQDRLKTQEERQKSRDIFDLMQAGFMRPEELTQRQQAVTQQGGEVARQALMSALSPRAGAPMPAVSGQGVGTLSEALATAGRPAQRLAYGGQEFVRAEAPQERQERLAGLEYQRDLTKTQAESRIRAEERAEDRRSREQQAEANARLQRDLTQMRIDANRALVEARADEEAGKPPARPTEAQEKSFLFAQRMAAANPIIEQYGPRARLDRISAALAADNAVTRAIANRMLSDEEQQLVVAIRQFAEPILRKNTGAAFNKEEIGWVESQVIPVSGDSEATQKYKSASRMRELETFNNIALPASRYYSQFGATSGAIRPTGRQEAATAARRPLPFNPDEF
jgi:hypothetical protein